MAGKRTNTKTMDSDAEIYEATAGWDSYVSDLLSGDRQDVAETNEIETNQATPLPTGEERRKEPRDRTPARRRTVLLAEDSAKESR